MHIWAGTNGYALTIGALTNGVAGFSMNGLEWWSNPANTNEPAGFWHLRALYNPSSGVITAQVASVLADPGNAAYRQWVFWADNGQPLVRIQPRGVAGSRALAYGTNVLAGLPVGFVTYGSAFDYPIVNLATKSPTDGTLFSGVNKDSHPRFYLLGNGVQWWGPGTAWGDVSLGRSTTNTLTVWGNLTVTGILDGVATALTPAAAQTLTGSLAGAETLAATVAGATNATVLAAQLAEAGLVTGPVAAVSLLITNAFPGPGSVLASDDGVHLYWKEPSP
jgi:hypothetical protein